MNSKRGNLTIHSQNIFPIIKKWLYSDHDIYVREMISNACDAITKLRTLANGGQADISKDEAFQITVIYNKDDESIKFIDNGIGMTEEEVEKYINQIAFSGAEEFVKKFKDKGSEDQIIGHFGLGFYSAFMVGKLVTIDTLSYQEGAAPVFWSCDGSNEYEIKPSAKSTRGTEITIYLGEDGEDFKNPYKIKNTIKKYCNFMPYDIFFEEAGAQQEHEHADDCDCHDHQHEQEHEHADSCDCEEHAHENEHADSCNCAEHAHEHKDDTAHKETKKKREAINNKHPLYLKSPAQCSDQDYRDFYKEIFFDFKEPLFWIHLNMDYPFKLNGILYFPTLSSEFDTLEGQIKLYNSQVYVADNIKEVIPEFLLLLKGIIDCPDLPLNVSRSFLQNDGFVKKISEYIVKKVSDKLNALFKSQREDYNRYWDDINPFIKYGALRDDKFYEKIKDSILFKTTDKTPYTVIEYKEKMLSKSKNAEMEQKEHDSQDTQNQVVDFYYSDNLNTQAQYINLLKNNDIEVFELDERIDNAFISLIESKTDNIKFKRVDSDLSDALVDKTENEDALQLNDEIKAIFESKFKEDKLEIEFKAMKNADLPAMLTQSEQGRRMNDMLKMYSLKADGIHLPKELKLILNGAHPLVKYLIDDENSKENKELVAKQVIDLAKISNGSITNEELSEFMKRTNEITLMLLNK